MTRFLPLILYVTLLLFYTMFPHLSVLVEAAVMVAMLLLGLVGLVRAVSA